MTDVCVFRLIEDGRVVITAVVHVDDIFAVGQKERCDKSCVDLNRNIPVHRNLGELKWYGGCRYSRNREKGCSNDIPTELRGRVREEIPCDFRTERSA